MQRKYTESVTKRQLSAFHEINDYFIASYHIPTKFFRFENIQTYGYKIKATVNKTKDDTFFVNFHPCMISIFQVFHRNGLRLVLPPHQLIEAPSPFHKSSRSYILNGPRKKAQSYIGPIQN